MVEGTRPAPERLDPARLTRIVHAVRNVRRENLSLRRENERLKDSLRRTLSLAVSSPAFEGGLGGRGAVALYRNQNIARFLEHMNNIGEWALANGEQHALFLLRTVVLADFESIFAAAPLTVEEAERRSLLEWKLKDPAAAIVLCGIEEWNERARQDFMAEVLASGVDTSTWALVRHSAETPPSKSGPSQDDNEA
ncbi:MAG TPA: hypothetical protein VGV89_01565 [Thermoplasmata archaeon]|nr:hypothetical protein [Thermoplasmata archaeon]